MSFSVNTNAAALAAIQTLSATNKALESAQGRINSGLKVASAKDDASTFAIAQGLRSDIAGFKAVSDAISFGQATTNVALTASQTVTDTLTQIKSKVVAAQAANVDKASIQRDITALVGQVTSIVSGAQFNGVNLLDGTDPDLSVLASLNRSDAQTAPTPFNITVAAQDLTASTLGISGINVAAGSVALTPSADIAFAAADTLAVTAGGTTTTFEFVTSLSTDGLTASGNKAVLIDPTASAGANLAALQDVMKKNGFSTNYNSTGDIVVTSNSGDVTAATGTVGRADRH